MKITRKFKILWLLVLCAGLFPGQNTMAKNKIGSLPRIKINKAKAELGKHLFFDTRLSGDDSISCSSCHIPSKGFSDGQELSDGYPGNGFFRNVKTVINSAHARYFYWDGRLTGKDRDTLMRDHITETHFMNMDGRMAIQRLKQVPFYVKSFKKAFNGEASFGKILKALGEFQKSLVSKNVPFDRNRLSHSAKRGKKVFLGKGQCVQCHKGAYFSDNDAHNLGILENPRIVGEPDRHVTLRSFMKFLGVNNYENIREDVGFYVVTKKDEDRKKFVTPTLRELRDTAPYMHNGTFKTLEDVISFYNKGGGVGSELKELNLSAKEQSDLKSFLLSLSGDPINVSEPERYEYQLIKNWWNKKN